jgi:hypothetical protein
MLGFGGVSYYHPDSFEGISTAFDHPSSWILALEPCVTADFNITKFFRIGAGIGYRYIPNLDLSYKNASGNKTEIISPNALNGVNINLAFKFGLF